MRNYLLLFHVSSLHLQFLFVFCYDFYDQRSVFIFAHEVLPQKPNNQIVPSFTEERRQGKPMLVHVS